VPYDKFEVLLSVNVMIEGVMKNIENLTVVDEGKTI
jgi:hypothetical protein